METYRPLGPSVLALLLALSGTVESHAAGAQRRSGEGSADEGAPAAANLGFEIVWKRSLGSGYSGITVADGRVITMYSDGRFDTLVALDAAKGAELWRYRFAPTYRGHDGSVDGPLSTPTVDESLVYGLGPRGHLFAVRLADGQEQWSKNIVEAIGARPPFWGIATRPVVEGRVLIVQTGGIGGRSITGFDKRTGDILWSVGDDRVGYQSPGTMTLAGRRQVVTVSNRQIMGIVPQTGEILWSHQYNTDDLDGSSQPLPMGQDRFLLTPSPFEYRTEALLFRVQETENGLATEEVWRAPALSNSYAVPILHQDYLYGFNRSFLTCVDRTSGELVWKSRQPGGEGLALLGRYLVILGPGGMLVAADANPHGYAEKARLQVLDRGSLAAPSIADGRILVRNHTHIASVGVTESTGGKPRWTVETEPRLAESEFAAFVHRVKAASDKKVLIDDFIASHERFPVVEGDGLVHFVYHGPVDDIALLGSMTDWEASDPMERISGTDFYYKSYALEPGGRWEYLFNLNFDEYVTDPLNPRRSPGDWQEVSEVATPGWVEPRHLDEPVGARGSTESFRFESEILANEREVKVYLPSAYSAGQQRYPLLVVNNGVRVLELIKMDHSLDNLIGKSVAPLIVAFVGTPAEAHESWQEGGPPSYKEYGGLHTGMHARMLAEELVPRLDHTYRTLRQPEARAVMGTGSAGLTALYAALHHSTVFGKVAVQSLRPGPTPLQSSSFRPRPFWDALLALLQEKEPLPVQIYLDWARSELRSAEQDIDLRRDNGNLFRLLQEKGYTVGGGEYSGGPGWGSWQARTDKVLMALFPVQRED